MLVGQGRGDQGEKEAEGVASVFAWLLGVSQRQHPHNPWVIFRLRDSPPTGKNLRLSSAMSTGRRSFTEKLVQT